MAATYISWSRELGGLCADEFTTALIRIFDRHVRVLYSANSIPSGADWFQANQHALSECNSAIILVTRAGLSSPWLFFESGYLQNRRKITIHILLVGVSSQDILGTPFSHLQCKSISPLDLNDLFEHTKIGANISDEDIICPIPEEAKKLSELLSRLAKADASTMAYKKNTIKPNTDPFLYDACFALIQGGFKDNQIAEFFNRYGIPFDEYSNHVILIRG